MINVALPNRTLQLPSCWEDLITSQLLYTVEKLLLLADGKLNQMQFQQLLLLHYTGYKPALDLVHQDTIIENLVRLSELITFPLRQVKGETVANNQFATNPVPHLLIGTRRYQGPVFDVGIVVQTNMTAAQYCDAFDLCRAFAHTQSEDVLNRMICRLYQGLTVNRAKRIPHIIKFIIYFWFTGVIDYFVLHPVFSILFPEAPNSDKEDQYNLGMSERLMNLSLSGYGSMEDVSGLLVTEFFELQVHSLKTRVREAIARGASANDIAGSTGLSSQKINAL